MRRLGRFRVIAHRALRVRFDCRFCVLTMSLRRDGQRDSEHESQSKGEQQLGRVHGVLALRVRNGTGNKAGTSAT